MVASSSGWPGQTKVASGWPGTARSDFSKVIRSYLPQDRLAGADQAVPLADQGGHVGDLVAPRLALLMEPPSSRNASRKNDSMKCGWSRRASARSMSSRIFWTCGGIHAVVGQRTLLEKFLAVLAVGQVVDDLVQAGLDLGLVAVADRFDQQVAEPLLAEAAGPGCRRPCRRAPPAPARSFRGGACRRRLRASLRPPDSRDGTPRSGRCGGCGRSAAPAGSGSRAGRS